MEKSSESKPEEEIDRVFRSASALIGADKKLTLLRIGSDTTVLATGENDLRTDLFELGIGTGVTSRAFFRSEIPSPAEVKDAIYLDRRATEELFTRYALISMGRPEAFDSVKMDREFFANLLILREVMHHLGFERIRIAG